MAQRTVAIIGLGLIGGSLARDLAARGARVLGYDRDQESVRLALDSGAVHAALDAALTGIAEAEWLILAVPVSEAAEILGAIASASEHLTLITDVGSTKRGTADAARQLGLAQFVGSHPMAGCHRSGWGASRPGLFEDATVFLCADTDTRAEAVDHARVLWESLGATPTLCSAEEHDEHVAWVSHLAHFASFALALAIQARGKRYSDLGRGGRDAVRLAASSPAMWRAIGMENAAEISRAISALERELQGLRSALERDDGDGLEERFARSATWCDPQSS
ncbi:MAG TPA: prephenate dehydrogenase [Gemmatimonadaceae bacterium]|nr:prephenate dehydrogenase [Gemmatimonadaceae bacterium]